MDHFGNTMFDYYTAKWLQQARYTYCDNTLMLETLILKRC